MITVHEAIRRGQSRRWSANATHTENETAYLDRTLLATEVIRLQQELAATETALTEAEREIEDMTRTIGNMNWM